MKKAALPQRGFGLATDISPISLSDRFGVPPFTVLDARQGEWQSRKRAWLSLGIQSEVGRDAAAYTVPKGDTECAKIIQAQGTGTSIFDPMLCELAYRWFCPEGGTVLDPFAGGSVRGVVAATLGLPYTGIELRAEQVTSNEAQWADIGSRGYMQGKPAPKWVTGDSKHVRALAPGSYDFIFSCPPYGNLEVYSDEPGDLSNMPDDDFIIAYRSIIKRTCSLLKKDRLICWVVGDYRDKRGLYRNFPGVTIQAFLDAGMHLYNEAILVTAVGSLPVRTSRQFPVGRKLGKTHQNILVFYKGDNPANLKAVFNSEGETK